jgi:hypothetical protein
VEDLERCMMTTMADCFGSFRRVVDSSDHQFATVSRSASLSACHVVGIIDHQDITADAQKRAADTGRKARAALGIIDLDFRILIIAESETRPPKPLIERRLYQASRQVGVA